MNAAEATIRHEDDDIAGAMLAYDRVDNGVDVRDVTSLVTPGLKIVDQLRGIEALGFRQRRPEYGREDHLIGRAKRAREIVLEDTTARRRRARLEDGPYPLSGITDSESGERFLDRSRVVREIVQYGDAICNANGFEPAFDALE